MGAEVLIEVPIAGGNPLCRLPAAHNHARTDVFRQRFVEFGWLEWARTGPPWSAPPRAWEPDAVAEPTAGTPAPQEIAVDVESIRQ
jgi:hypothetical protein